MPESDTAPAEHLLAVGRIVLWACIAIATAVLALFASSSPAHALTVALGPNGSPPTAVVAVGEEAEEESAESEEEVDPDQIEEEEEEEEEDSPPAECLLQTARARVTAYPAQSKVLLLVRYSSSEPADAAIDYRLKGSKGSLTFAESKQRLADRGVIRLSENLSKGETTKVLAAKNFTVELHIPAAPDDCRRFQTRHLTIEHESSSRLTWLQSDSIFGT